MCVCGGGSGPRLDAKCEVKSAPLAHPWVKAQTINAYTATIKKPTTELATPKPGSLNHEFYIIFVT